MNAFAYPARISVPLAMEAAAGDSGQLNLAYPLLATIKRRATAAQAGPMPTPKAGEKPRLPGPGRPPNPPISPALRGSPGFKTALGK